jgi:hypothetical protein
VSIWQRIAYRFACIFLSEVLPWVCEACGERRDARKAPMHCGKPMRAPHVAADHDN